jgi:predicted HTH domain antitoxin
MEKKIKISARFDPALLKRVDAYASKRYTDRSSAIQQLVSFALREIKKEALQAYREGRMTIRQCADMLGVDYFEMDEILNSENVPIITGLDPDEETLLPRLKETFSDKEKINL